MNLPKDPIRVTRDQNPLTQGAKYGITGCAGCTTFVVAGVVLLLILLIAIGHH